LEKDVNLEKLEKDVNLEKLVTETSRAHYYQKIWRQKQINIFYLTGRPIFDIPVDIPVDKNIVYNAK